METGFLEALLFYLSERVDGGCMVAAQPLSNFREGETTVALEHVHSNMARRDDAGCSGSGAEVCQSHVEVSRDHTQHGLW